MSIKTLSDGSIVHVDDAAHARGQVAVLFAKVDGGVEVRIPDRGSKAKDAFITKRFVAEATNGRMESIDETYARARAWTASRLKLLNDEILAKKALERYPAELTLLFAEDGSDDGVSI